MKNSFEEVKVEPVQGSYIGPFGPFHIEIKLSSSAVASGSASSSVTCDTGFCNLAVATDIFSAKIHHE